MSPATDTTPASAESEFRARFPHLAAGLCADRAWLWWSGPKPEEAERQQLTALGWRFARTPHALPDGRAAHWFHPCGGRVFRGARRASVTTRQHSRVAGAGASSDDALARLAALLP